jgi:hypothetical protein
MSIILPRFLLQKLSKISSLVLITTCLICNFFVLNTTAQNFEYGYPLVDELDNSQTNYQNNYQSNYQYCSNVTGKVTNNMDSNRNYYFKLSTNLSYQNGTQKDVYIYVQNTGKYYKMTRVSTGSSNTNNCQYMSNVFSATLSPNNLSEGSNRILICAGNCSNQSSIITTTNVNVTRQANRINYNDYYTNRNYQQKRMYTGVLRLNYRCDNPNSIYLLARPTGECANYQNRDSEMVRLMSMYQRKYRIQKIADANMMQQLSTEGIIFKSGGYWSVNMDKLYASVNSSDWVVPTSTMRRSY